MWPSPIGTPWRRLCNRFFLVTLRVLIAVNQFVLLTPIARYRGHSPADYVDTNADTDDMEWSVYRTHWLLTGVTLLGLLGLASAAPSLVRIHTSMYSLSSIPSTGHFANIAFISLVSGVTVSLLIVATHLWHRHRLATFINRFMRILDAVRQLREDFIDCWLVVLLSVRLALLGYELSLSLPFLIRHGGQMRALNLFACLVTLLVEHVRSLFAVDMMAAILLLSACYGQLERSLSSLAEDTFIAIGSGELEEALHVLIRLEQALQRLLQLFTATFETSLCLLLIGAFVNLLSNLYGMVYHSVYSHNLYPTLIFYNASLVADMYALIFCSHLCCEQHRAVKEAFFRLFYCTGGSQGEIEASMSGHLQPHPLWPPEVEFQIVGLFKLTHQFWLFLVSYAVNFIVIIMEFAVREIRSKANQLQ